MLRDTGIARIDAIVHKAVEAEQVPGVVVGVQCGDQMHIVSASDMTVGGAPMSHESIFRIASITKPMTAACVLSLAEAGLVDLDEPIERLLPELADRRVLRRHDGPLDDTVPAHRQPTVRELLTFTWGFGMQGAMFTASEPWPIHTATIDRDLHTFGEPHPGRTPDPDT